MMKLWMHLILFAAFISAYANPVDCEFETNSCSWSVMGFRRISDYQFNSTDGWNDIMQGNDCNFLDGLCSWEGKESNVPTKVNYEFKSTKDKSLLTFGFDIYPGENCLSFKYQIKDFKTECSFIDVKSYYADVWSQVWSSQRHHHLQGWNEINVTINVGNKSKITFRFGSDNCSDATYYISSISLKKPSCTESTTTFRTSPSIVNPTDITTSTAATTVNTSSYYAKDGVIIGIVICGLAFTVALLLIATYLYRRRATSPNANISKYSTVASVTYSGAMGPNPDNGETSHATERLNQTSETVPYNAPAEYSNVLKTQPRQSKTQQRFMTGILNIYPCQVQLLNNDGNSVTNPEQTHNQYHQNADEDGTYSYDTVHSTDNHMTEFRDDTYDCTTIYPTTIPDPTYDHSNFKQNFDNIYDQSKSGTLNKDMRYLDHSCDTTLQLFMQDVDKTYDHT